MFKDVTKIISSLISIIGLGLIIYGWTDRTMLSLGQTLMTIGAILFMGGMVVYQVNKLNGRVALATHILRDIDASLSIPPQTQNHDNHNQDMLEGGFLPPKTTSMSFDQDLDFKMALEKEAQNILPPAPVPAPQPVQAPTVIATKAEDLSRSLETQAPLAPQRRDYYNELASYLEPPNAPLKPVEPLPEPMKPALELRPQVLAPVVEAPPPPPVVAATITMPEKTITYNDRLSELANDFPELDALLKRNSKEEVAPVTAPVPEPVVEAPPLPAVIREGQIAGIPFKLFSDGTIEAQFSNGSHRFISIADFRNYVEGV